MGLVDHVQILVATKAELVIDAYPSNANPKKTKGQPDTMSRPESEDEYTDLIYNILPHYRVVRTYINITRS